MENSYGSKKDLVSSIWENKCACVNVPFAKHLPKRQLTLDTARPKLKYLVNKQTQKKSLNGGKESQKMSLQLL